MGRMTSTSGCSESVSALVMSGGAVNNGGYQDVMFPPGATVHCTTSDGRHYDGEIVAFDLATRMLALLIGTKPNVKLTLVNLAHVNNQIRVIKEPATAGPSFVPRGNCEKARLRFDEAVERKRRGLPLVEVSKEGLLLFRSLSSTYFKMKDLHWEEDRIVFQRVAVVKSPYGLQNVELMHDASSGQHHASCALDQLSKQVEKFWRCFNRNSNTIAQVAVSMDVINCSSTVPSKPQST